MTSQLFGLAVILELFVGAFAVAHVSDQVEFHRETNCTGKYLELTIDDHDVAQAFVGTQHAYAKFTGTLTSLSFDTEDKSLRYIVILDENKQGWSFLTIDKNFTTLEAQIGFHRSLSEPSQVFTDVQCSSQID